MAQKEYRIVKIEKGLFLIEHRSTPDGTWQEVEDKQFKTKFEGIRSLANSDEPARDFGTSVFTKKGHDYLLVDTKHGVCVIHAESCHCRLDTLGIYVVDNKDTTYVIKKK